MAQGLIKGDIGVIDFSSRWRPDSKEIAQAEALSAAGLTKDQIADYLGVSRVMFAEALNQSEELRRKIARGSANAIANVAKTAYSMAVKGDNGPMTQFYLKCRAGWSYKTIIEHEGVRSEGDEKKTQELVESVKRLISERTGAIKDPLSEPDSSQGQDDKLPEIEAGPK